MRFIIRSQLLLTLSVCIHSVKYSQVGLTEIMQKLAKVADGQ